MLRRVDRILLSVPALNSAVAYYRDTLGLKVLRQDKQAASLVMADGVTELVLRDDPDQSSGEIYYLVDDVRELYERREELKLVFVHPPRAITRGYRAAVRDPFGNVLLLLDRSTEGAEGGVVEDAAEATALFPGVETPAIVRADLLIQLYEKIGRTADDLPYTPQFEKLWTLYSAGQTPAPSRGEVWRQLLNIHKAGKLPRLGSTRLVAQKLEAEEERGLRELLGDDIGKRDRLPYTERFDRLVDQFNHRRKRPLGPHQVWRLVARLAK
jgi:catechol 2,3-dioxygenase-like lactoylglutathione lyase family enzyme